MRLTMLMTVALALLAPASAAEPTKRSIEFNSDQFGLLGLPLAECAKPVRRISLTADVDDKGEGTGVLVLDLTELPTYDELGFPTLVTPGPTVKLDCTLKFVKKTTVKVMSREPIPAPEQAAGAAEEPVQGKDVEWKLYAITGPKITSRLFLATSADDLSRLLVHGENGKVKYVVDLFMPPVGRVIPCHPGCFPAGTLIQRPGGTGPIEQVRAGDVVTTIGPDGVASRGRVDTVFCTTNRLIEVRTGAGTLMTTETQPLALANGGLRAASALKKGDRIWRWDGSERRLVEVLSVSATRREERVFNLILSDSELFIANGFLARSKPPVALPERP